MLDPVQSTRMGVVRLTDLMPVVTMVGSLMVSMLAIMVLGTMLGTEVPTWLVRAAHDVSIPDARQPGGTGWACG
jgi:hypothetical protein